MQIMGSAHPECDHVRLAAESEYEDGTVVYNGEYWQFYPMGMEPFSVDDKTYEIMGVLKVRLEHAQGCEHDASQGDDAEEWRKQWERKVGEAFQQGHGGREKE